jgi:hypothetical protein
MSESPLLQGVFKGNVAFSQLVRDALACAAREGWKEMVWSDANFEDWPLREKAVVDSLYAWAQKGRQLTLLAHSFDSVLRYQPRMVTWRKTWGHIVECRSCKQVEKEKFPSVLWSPVWAMERRDVNACAGIAGFEAQRRVQLKEALNECQRYSSPGFPASILGL